MKFTTEQVEEMLKNFNAPSAVQGVLKLRLLDGKKPSFKMRKAGGFAAAAVCAAVAGVVLLRPQPDGWKELTAKYSGPVVISADMLDDGRGYPQIKISDYKGKIVIDGSLLSSRGLENVSIPAGYIPFTNQTK